MSFLHNLPIKLRLYIMVGLVLCVALFVGLLGLNGMRNAAHAIDELYNQDMAHIRALGIILEAAEDSRSQVLLSLQHDPNSSFSSMHDHPVSVHLEQIDHNIKEIDKHWAEFMNSHLDAEEKRLAALFQAELVKFEKEAIEKIEEGIRTGHYHEAESLVLSVVNPVMKEMKETIESLVNLQEEEAAAFFTESGENYHSMITWVVISLAIGAIISLVLAYHTITTITQGVNQIELKAKQLSEGDLGARVEYSNKDELGRIASAFNKMADKFHDTINEVKDSVSQLASAAEETSTVTTQTTQGISQQLTETSQVATAMNEMSATVQEVARNAVDAAEAAREADNTFHQGKQVIDKVIDAIGELAKEVEQAAGVIQQLESESMNIGSVLDVIKSIAEQTNLLALNAAIEAARAGEQGRGFAVVADEVRTLAGRTQESTQEIEEMISKLQSGANNAVKVMAEGKEMTQVGVEQAAAAGEALQTINTAVEQISNMNTQIASAAEEQSSVTEEINRSIVSINEVAEQSAAGAQQTSQASDDLAKLAEQLKGLVGRFKV
ncbi:MAG: methyl-accepting chemotaxis protein [Candidatus Thiodiazotropha endolucinida]